MSPTCEATVLICTYNRCQILKAALASLEVQTLAPERFEVLVIDNASTDDTRGVVEEHQTRTRLALRYVREDRLGLCVARNRGVREAKGALVVFFDDDAKAEPDWLAELVEVARSTASEVVGGKIVPDWQAPRPPWLSEALMRYLIVLDYGEEVVPVTWMPFFYGTNMAFRADVLARLGPFREDLDRVGNILAGGGDTEMCLRAHRAGLTLTYVPRAVVHHQIPASRLTRTFFRTRFYYSGRARAAHTPDPLWKKAAMVAGLAAGALAVAPAIALAHLVRVDTLAMKLERLALVAAGYLHHQVLVATGRL